MNKSIAIALQIAKKNKRLNPEEGDEIVAPQGESIYDMDGETAKDLVAAILAKRNPKPDDDDLDLSALDEFEV